MTTAAEPAYERRDWLVAARERTGRSQESLGHVLGVAARTVANWERGRTLPKIDIRRDLAESLGLTLDELNRRLGLPFAPDPAELNGNSADPFARATDWLSLFVRAEQAAYGIWTFTATAFPALCQTAGYARTVEAGGHREFTPDEIDEFVEARLARAAVLNHVDYSALIAAPLVEAATGGPEVMAEQMAHLMALTDRPNVTLQLLDVEHLFATPGEFTLLATSGPDADMATEGGINSDHFEDGPRAAANHVRLFDHLASLAQDPEVSRSVIARAADRFAAMATNKRGSR
jgi:transcriptional regulator with XRE-family HTH domain